MHRIFNSFNMEAELLRKVAMQTLSESLGYDEAKAYFYTLTNQENKLIFEYSYSKRYRLLKSLFMKGAMAKIKPHSKDFFSYVPLPPTFLVYNDADNRILEFLENIYLENHLNRILTDFSQLILKNERPLVVFMIKYLMKEDAKLVLEQRNIPRYVGEKSSMISFCNSRTSMFGKKMGIIDGKICFEFSSIKGEKGTDFIGFLSREGYAEDIAKSISLVC